MAEEAAEQPPSPSKSKIKEMRRIAERTESPTDKTELVNYLNERIKQAEDALNDTEELLDSEIKERQKISQMIEGRNLQLQKLYQIDQKGLPQKIKQKLTQILTTTISQKVDAQQKLSEQKHKNYEFKTMYGQLKWQQKNITHQLTEQANKETKLNQDITDIDTRNTQHETEIKELQDNFNGLKEKKESLENKYLQMKVALERMNDVKAVLNRFFGSEDLFDQKMDLKQQRIQRVQVPQSRQSQPRIVNKETKTLSKLKPLNHSAKNDDQDFWRGDFSKPRN